MTSPQVSDRVPSEAELRSAGVRYGLLAEGEPVPPRRRAEIAKRINSEERAAAAEAAAEAAVEATQEKRGVVREQVTAELVAIHRDLTYEGISDQSAGRVLAALAPVLWRTTIA